MKIVLTISGFDLMDGSPNFPEMDFYSTFAISKELSKH